MLIYAASPFQLVSAITLAEIKKSKVTGVIIFEGIVDNSKYGRICDILSVDQQLMRVVNYSKMPQIKKLQFLFVNIILCSRNNVIIGSANNVYFRMVTMLSKSCTVVDDGVEVFDAADTFKSFSINKKFIFRLMDKINKPHFFSVLRNVEHSLQASNCISKKFELKKKVDSSKVLLILSPLCEDGVVTVNSYKKMLHSFIRYFRDSTGVDSVIIAKHPRSQQYIVDLTLSLINQEMEACIWEPSATLELSLVDLNSVPMTLASFESTASIIVEKMYKKQFLHLVFQIPTDYLLNSRRERRMAISKNFRKVFKGKIINEDSQ